ncbi:MAG: PKD domain-containing protein [Planctomycetota bacterium]|nr:PKD domain-containing protein [Planctomycetota bacterium]
MSRLIMLFCALVFSLLAGGSAWGATADSFEPDNDNADDATYAAGLPAPVPLAIEVVGPNSRTRAKAITNGQTQKHTLPAGDGTFLGDAVLPADPAKAADRDVVKFTLSVKSDILLQTDVDIGPADTVLRLFDSNGVQIGYDDQGNPAGDNTSRLTITELDPGTYYAVVEEWQIAWDNAQNIESYKLSFLTAPTGQKLPPLITSKDTANGALGGNFVYTITALGGQPMSFKAQILPPGLELAGDQVVGVPTQTGVFSTVTLEASNGTAPNSTKTITITVTEFGVIATVAGDGSGRLAGDGNLGNLASVKQPNGVAMDAKGNIFVADTGNHVIRRIDADTGVIITIVGDGSPGYSGDGGPANRARLSAPGAVAVDGQGSLYIADTGNSVIRKVNAADGKINRIAGSATVPPTAGFADGAATAVALFSSPSGLALDGAGSLYIADTSNHVIRKLSGGNVTTVAGTVPAPVPVPGNTGDGAAATAATLSNPTGVAVDGSGNMYIADRGNNRVRKVVGGTISNFAGDATAAQGFSGDGAAATSATLANPTAVAVDASGNVYISDTWNMRIRKVAAGKIDTIVGGGTPDWSLPDRGVAKSDGGAVLSAVLAYPLGVAVDSTGANILIADAGSNRVRRAAAATVPVITSALTLSGTKDSPLSPPYRITATGHPVPSFSVTGLPLGLSLRNGVIGGVPTQSGVADVALSARNTRGEDRKIMRVTISGTASAPLGFSDTKPAIIVSPNPAKLSTTAPASVTVTVVCPNVANGLDLKAYTWDFGDAADTKPGYGDVGSHKYTAAGIYTVTLTVTDGASTLTLTERVAVNASDVSEGVIISKAQFKFDFSSDTSTKDSLGIAGLLPFRKSGTVSSSSVNIYVGSLNRTYTLDSKGKGTGPGGKNDVFKLSAKTTSGAIDEAGLYVWGKFTMAIKSTNLKTDLAALGFVKGVTTSKPIKVPILLTINGDSYLETVTVVFKSSEKSGSGAKLKEGGSLPTR